MKCNVANLFQILCLVLVSLMGAVMDMDWKEHVSSEILLEAVLTSCIIKSLSALATLIATKAAPPVASLQVYIVFFSKIPLKLFLIFSCK